MAVEKLTSRYCPCTLERDERANNLAEVAGLETKRLMNGKKEGAN
jgi:hypothetical protein